MYAFNAPHGHPTLPPQASSGQQAALEAHAAQMGSFARRLGAQAALVAERTRVMEQSAHRGYQAHQGYANPPPQGPYQLPAFLFDRNSSPAQTNEWTRQMQSGVAPSNDYARAKAVLAQRRAAREAYAQAEEERKYRAHLAQERILGQAWEEYEARWGEMNMLSPSSPGATGTLELGFQDLPWPCHPQPRSLGELKAIDIQRLLLSRSHSRGMNPSQRVKQQLLRWHPDKFEGRWMKRVRQEEREDVREGVRRVGEAFQEAVEEWGRRGGWQW